MMHQIIVPVEDIANAINNIVDGNVYQIIPFKRDDTEVFKNCDTNLFLILWEDHYSTSSVAYGDRGEPKRRVNDGYQPLTSPSTPPPPPKTGSNTIKAQK